MEGRASAQPLLLAGVIGPTVFVVVFLIEGATRVGYDAFRNYVSTLSLGEGGWMQTANFIVSGLLFIAFAFGLSARLEPGRGATSGPRLMGAVGIGLIVAGVFVADPTLGYPPGTPPGTSESFSDHGFVHVLGALLVFGGIPAVAIMFARRAAAQPARRGWRIYSFVSAVAMLVFFVAANVAAADDSLRPIAGLLQRVSIVSGFAWVALLALLALRQEPAL